MLRFASWGSVAIRPPTFPAMVSEQKGNAAVLRACSEDRSAVIGFLAQIETLGLEFLELRRLPTTT